ncbi:MAG: undecaprenyl-diphosphate phosphatase, partial [Pseudomonadota bacterium]|nr:undecaprenyl-diphosphate phosphatase [Pseudomonadota bacterium]
MALYQILVLAIVQGVTEFLPISSSGHLVLTSKVLE